MPTKQVALTATPKKIVKADPQRTVLTISNKLDANIAFISDDRGSGITDSNGYPIFPETHLSFERKQGDEPQKAWWGVCAAGETTRIAILEAYGEIVQPVPAEEPSPQEPYHPKDAPRMRPII